MQAFLDKTTFFTYIALGDAGVDFGFVRSFRGPRNQCAGFLV